MGERRATVGQVLPTRVTMRDYNPFRVRLAWLLVKADGPPQGLAVLAVNMQSKDTSHFKRGLSRS